MMKLENKWSLKLKKKVKNIEYQNENGLDF